MRIRIWLGIGFVGILYGIAPWADPGALAQPSGECRELAGRFASRPDGMDISALAELGGCVTTEIKSRATAQPPLNPPPAQEQAPQPNLPGVSDRGPNPVWGQWPSTAPWQGNWPQEAPWYR